MTEVSLDAAVSLTPASLSAETTEMLDSLLEQAVDRCQQDPLIPLQCLICHFITKEFHSQKNISIVESFRYLFVTGEKIISGVDVLPVDEEAAVVECSKDFAASYLRLGDQSEDQIASLEEKLSRADIDLADKLQAQSDLTFGRAASRDVGEFHKSLVREVDILLQVRDYEKAYFKIINNKLFGPGLRSFSAHTTQIALDNFEEVLAVRKRIFEKYLDFLDDSDGGFPSEVQRDREQADIVVDMKGRKGFRDGQFFVTDLESGLRLAQNKGGTIFLEGGDYHADTFHQVKLNTPEQRLTVLGSSTSLCSIHGTMKIHSENKIIFRRLKIEVGDSAESKDAIFLTKGSAVFEDCLIEAAVNSLFYVLSHGQLSLVRCHIDGLESCQRCLSLSGAQVSIVMEDCWCRDLLSVVTLLQDEAVSEVNIRITGCELEGVQSVISAAVDNISAVTMEESSLTLVLYDQDVESVGIKIEATEKRSQSAVRSNNNYINFKHIDGKGFRLKNIKSVDLTRTLIVTEEDIDRKLAICEAVTSESVDNLSLENIFIRGFRYGLNVNKTKSVSVSFCTVEKCSIGVHISQPSHSSSVSSKVLVKDCELKSTYYGIFGRDKEAKLHIVDSKFLDIPKPLLLCREMIAGLVEESCQYLLTREYSTAPDFTTLEKELNLHLATCDNLPHRAAYERDDVEIVYKYNTLGFTDQ